jgi:hypothetical protein
MLPSLQSQVSSVDHAYFKYTQTALTTSSLNVAEVGKNDEFYREAQALKFLNKVERLPLSRIDAPCVGQFEGSECCMENRAEHRG